MRKKRFPRGRRAFCVRARNKHIFPNQDGNRWGRMKGKLGGGKEEDLGCRGSLTSYPCGRVLARENLGGKATGA